MIPYYEFIDGLVIIFLKEDLLVISWPFFLTFLEALERPLWPIVEPRFLNTLDADVWNLILFQVKNPWPNVDAHSGVLLNYYGLTEARY